MNNTTFLMTLGSATVCVAMLGGGCDDTSSTGGAGGKGGSAATTPNTLFVAHGGVLAAYDIATGKARAGEIQDIAGPTDMQALADGTMLVNLSDKNQVLVFDGNTMLEKARIPSSTIGGTRPVHSYISPELGGKSYWIAMNDGTGALATNSALFIDVSPTSATYLKPVGEVALGVGHHKAAFSATKERVVISNIGDCDNVLSVYDYSDPKNIKTLATLDAAAAGWDGSSFAKTCDPTYQMGVPPAPHGCGTSKVSGKAYCNITSSGGIAEIDIDAATPTFKIIPTTGAGGGYTKPSLDGRYVFSLQGEPREGMGGADCQIGQMSVVDGTTGTIAASVPLLYKGPGCTDKLVGTDEETSEPAHIVMSEDGKKLFIEVAGGFGVMTARVRQEIVIDVSNPAAPTQLASIPIGVSTSYHGDAISGDGKFVFLANNIDGTVSQIDVATNAVVATLKVEANPQTIFTFGSAEGPGAQTGPFH